MVVVVGSMAGEYLSFHGYLSIRDRPFFGAQGWEYLDLGKFWMYLLVVGLLLWLAIMYRGLRGRLATESRGNMPWLFFYSAVSIPLFYAVGLVNCTQTPFAIADFWRFWVVHLWVEDFLELFTTMMVAYIFVLLGVVSERVATRLIYFDVILYSMGGVVGTMHHVYFSGSPAIHMALGAFFSAAEVIPLTLLTVEAWTFLQLAGRQQVGEPANRFPHRWAVLFLASVGFWNFLGAGVFGFLINLPVVSYYQIGTYLTSNHGHAAMMGVYGMLALALMVFCLRYLMRPEDWSDRLVGYSFWTVNIGLMLMVFANLFPVGILQLADVVTNGYWHARSEFAGQHAFLEWMRLPGDVIFVSGTFPLLWMAAKGAFRPRPATAPRDETGAAVEAPLFTEVLPGGEPSSDRDEAGGMSAMTPVIAAWTLPADLELWLFLGYVAVLWLGAWLLEAMARVHFHRALRHAHEGFDYDPGLDRYECPQGELLTLQTYDDRNKLAIYKAPASSCNGCVLKTFCTPHDEGRHVYRSLAEFVETDTGRFHQWLSFLLLALAVAFAASGVIRWWGRPGEGLFLIALMLSLVFLWLDVRGCACPDLGRRGVSR